MHFDTLLKTILEIKQDRLTVFLTKRKAGAAKIEESARKKGGLASLTAAHFKAKLKPYTYALEQSTGKSLNNCKEKTLQLLKQLEDIDNISQVDWQKLTGELEAHGEAYIESLKYNK